MISYWVDNPCRHGIENYLLSRGAPLASRFAVSLYEDLGPQVRLRGGSHIFAALDQLTPAGLELAGELCDRMGAASPAWVRLNHPRRVRLRRPLLDTLADLGLNDFRVWPANGPLDRVRYPAFVRPANKHTGNMTELLDSPSALRQALRALRFRGARLEELLVVEYLHTADARGVFRKYSAYRIGSALVRTHLFAGHAWSLKAAGNEADLQAAREMQDYVTGDQDEEWLWRVFELAGIEYGRVDYARVDGRPQLWEINLTPWICRNASAPPAPVPPDVAEVRTLAREFAHERLRAAFLAIDACAAPAELTLQLPPALVAKVQAERAAEARRRAALLRLARLFSSPMLGRPVRALYGKVLPRR